MTALCGGGRWRHIVGGVETRGLDGCASSGAVVLGESPSSLPVAHSGTWGRGKSGGGGGQSPACGQAWVTWASPNRSTPARSCEQSCVVLVTSGENPSSGIVSSASRRAWVLRKIFRSARLCSVRFRFQRAAACTLDTTCVAESSPTSMRLGIVSSLDSVVDG